MIYKQFNIISVCKTPNFLLGGKKKFGRPKKKSFEKMFFEDDPQLHNARGDIFLGPWIQKIQGLWKNLSQSHTNHASQARSGERSSEVGRWLHSALSSEIGGSSSDPLDDDHILREGPLTRQSDWRIDVSSVCIISGEVPTSPPSPTTTTTTTTYDHVK